MMGDFFFVEVEFGWGWHGVWWHGGMGAEEYRVHFCECPLCLGGCQGILSAVPLIGRVFWMGDWAGLFLGGIIFDNLDGFLAFAEPSI